MLQGSREAVVRKVQPISVHGQLSLDIIWTPVDDPDAHPTVTRIGPEAVSGDVGPGDRIRLDYVLGVVTAVTRITRRS